MILTPRTHILGLALALASGLAPVAAAQNAAVEAQKLIPSNSGFPGALFGEAVAISGHTAVVGGAHRQLANGDHDGRVHVYRRSSTTEPWALERTLRPEIATPDQDFGAAVAIDGELLIVGAPGNTAGVDGAAYVFRFSAGEWVEALRVSEPANNPSGGYFGASVDVDGTTFVVADPRAQGNGRVYVYAPVGNTWQRQATLGPASGSSGSFGFDVSLYGDRLAIGLVRRNIGTGGEVRILRRTAGVWSLEQVVQPDSVPYGQYAEDDFGASLDLVNTTLLIGAPDDRNPAQSSTNSRGAAFVFRLTGGSWSQYTRIDPIMPQSGARFGSDVQLGGELYAAIGADGYSSAASSEVSKGTIYTFRRNGGLWLQNHVLRANGGQEDELFGAEVAIASRGADWTVLGGAFREGFGDPGAVHSFELTAATQMETQRLLEPAKTGVEFGGAVAVDGAYAVVGAPREDTAAGEDIGAAYVYERSGASWELVQRLAPAALLAGDHFGANVTASGTTIVVAAPDDDRGSLVDCGTVYVFQRVTGAWSLTATLTANDAASFDYFGTSVALRGDLLIVGAHGDNNSFGSNAGAAYLFTRSGSTWTQSSKLNANDMAAGDRFGTSVAVVSSTRVVVGAPESDVAGTNAGSAYVFDRIPIIGGVAWIQRTRLSPPGLVAGDGLGSSVAASGVHIVIGAPRATVSPFQRAGKIHLYEITSTIPGMPSTTFTFRQSSSDPQPGHDHAFGSALAIDGTQLAAGVSHSDQFGLDWAGKVVLFRRQAGSLWNVIETDIARDPGQLELFGDSVALSGNWLLVGAPQDTHDAGDFGGAVYALDLWASGAVGESYCGAVTNQSGQSATLEGVGSAFIAANSLVLRAARLPLNASGFFLVSRTEGFVLNPGGARGNLCLGGAVGRFVGPGQIKNSGPSGAFELPLDLNALPQPGGTMPSQPGQTWRFQAWFRDIGPAGPTSNFTPGLAVVIH